MNFVRGVSSSRDRVRIRYARRGAARTVPLLALALAANALRAESPPPGGESLFDRPAHEVFQLRQPEGGGARVETIAVSDRPFDRALRVRIPGAGKNPYDIELKSIASRPVRKGDTLWLAFWWRAAPETDTEFEAMAKVYVSKASPPWTGLYSEPIGAKTEWRLVQVPFVAAHDLDARDLQVTFHLAYRPQVVDFGGMTLLNYGPKYDLNRLPRTRESYAGMEPEAPWRARALERIERIRKSELAVRVVETDGRPAAGAAVRATQRRSAFGFGTMISPSTFFGQPTRPSKGNRGYATTPEDAARNREALEKYFNLFTPGAALVYNGWLNDREPREALEILRWARARGFATRGHFLVQPDMRVNNWFRPLHRDADEPEVYRRLEAYIRRAVPATRELVDYWDGINHAGRWKPGEEESISIEFQARALQLAKALNPDIRLFVTENFILSGGDADAGTRRADFEAKIRALQKLGAPIDGIAFQGHFDHRLTSPEKLLETMDRFGRLAPLLQVTEFDISISDEDLAAAYTRDLLIACFSHPQMNAFQMWGFWDADHWKSDAPMFRRDWSLKPAGATWIEWVTRRWRTAAEGVADAEGVFRVRGFHGDYDVRAERDGRRAGVSVRLGPDGAEARIVLPAGPSAD